MSGNIVASEMRRTEAANSRCRNQDASGTLAELAALRAAIGACLAQTGYHCPLLIAQAVEALKEFRTEIIGEDGLIHEQQVPIPKLSTLFNDRDGDH